MAHDDAARVQRLREEPRTDRSLDERMYAFCAALQHRLCVGLERLDGTALCSRAPWDGVEGRGEVGRLAAGAVIAEGVVEVARIHGLLDEASATPLGFAPQPFVATGLRMRIRPRAPHAPGLVACVRYLGLGPEPMRPAETFFSGRVELEVDPANRAPVEAFRRFWHLVLARHPGAQGVSAPQPVRLHEGKLRGIGIAFDGPRGDPEGAFHLIREVGRGLLASYVPLLPARENAPEAARGPVPSEPPTPERHGARPPATGWLRPSAFGPHR